MLKYTYIIETLNPVNINNMLMNNQKNKKLDQNDKMCPYKNCLKNINP